MISPCAWVSKYLIGRDSILRNRSSLKCRIVPWLTLTMILLYVNAVITPVAIMHTRRIRSEARLLKSLEPLSSIGVM